jgi:CheY-like chemotaxis protein
VHECWSCQRRFFQHLEEHFLKPKLLIVDDSSVSRMMIRGRVSGLKPDWEVIEAANGDEALAMVAAQHPDYITMDVNMPGMSGFEAVEKIREIDQKARMVILTANIQVSSRERAEQLAVHFVQKPATLAAVQLAIDYFLAAA